MTALDDRATDTLTTGELVLAYDRTRDRSRQTELGISELGGCQRRAGYRLAGTPATDVSGSLQAAMGTAIHDGIARVFHQLQADGKIPADDLIEHEIRFGGVLGHLDRYDSVRHEVIDTKTTSDRWLQTVRTDGPPENNRWQVNLYAAALIVAGRPVRRVVLDYVARDTGAEYRWSAAPDPGMVRAALAWLDDVRDSELEMLPRAYDPDGPFCRNCAFRTVCWDVDNTAPGRDPRQVLFREDPDAARWAAKLDDARTRKAAAAAEEAEAKGALDALRPNDRGTAIVDVGYAKALQWRVSTTNRLDGDQVRADYRKAGAEPPTKPSETVTLAFTAKDAGVPAQRQVQS